MTEGTIVDVLPADVARDAIEYCYDQGWTDGLPVVPCTQALLDEFLATTSRDPDDILLWFKSVNRSCTVRDAAINAAMAGCLAAYFPTVIAAWEAIDADAWAGIGLLQSTSGSATMLVANGPIRGEIDVNCAGNIFGSGFRANATIGRAIRLTTMNVFGIHPHELDQATQGQPARFASFFGENEEASPWEPFHTQYGFPPDDSVVTAWSIRSISHIEARHAHEPEQLLRDIADTISRTGALLAETTSACVVLSPEHAALVSAAGWSRDDVRQFLVAESTVDRERLRAVGKSSVSHRSRFRIPDDHPDAVQGAGALGADEGSDIVHTLSGLGAVHVIVAGAPNAGVSSVVNLYGTGNAAIIPVGIR